MIVSGYIFDAMTGERLPAATVAVLNASGQYSSNGTVADANGNYSLNVDPSAKLKVTYVGYNPVTVTASDAAKYPISLFANNNLPEVVVTAPKPNYMDSVNVGPNGPTASDWKKSAILFGVLLLAGILITSTNDKKR